MCGRIFPKSKSSSKGVCVVACPAKSREPFQFVNVSATEHDLVRLERSDEALYDIFNEAPPFPSAKSFQSTKTDIVLESGLLVRQVSQFHRFDDAIHDQSGSQSSA